MRLSASRTPIENYILSSIIIDDISMSFCKLYSASGELLWIVYLTFGFYTRKGIF
jgi:hypothetical protein